MAEDCRRCQRVCPLDPGGFGTPVTWFYHKVDFLPCCKPPSNVHLFHTDHWFFETPMLLWQQELSLCITYVLKECTCDADDNCLHLSQEQVPAI